MTIVLTLVAMFLVLLVTLLTIVVTPSAWAYLVVAAASLSISTIGLFIDSTCNLAALFGCPLITGIGAVATVRRGKWRYKLPNPES